MSERLVNRHKRIQTGATINDHHRSQGAGTLTFCKGWGGTRGPCEGAQRSKEKLAAERRKILDGGSAKCLDFDHDSTLEPEWMVRGSYSSSYSSLSLIRNVITL